MVYNIKNLDEKIELVDELRKAATGLSKRLAKSVDQFKHPNNYAKCMAINYKRFKFEYKECYATSFFGYQRHDLIKS